jgi:hypothetical protein
VPTSVLLAVLAAAGLLALAPALVRRYDATERLVAERALSSARVLARAGVQRHRRRRTVPGRFPVNPPRTALLLASSAMFGVASIASSVAAGARASGAVVSDARATRQRGAVAGRRAALPATAAPPLGSGRRPRTRQPRAVYRRRRVLLALVLLNLAELVGAVFADRGFWLSFAVTGLLLLGYVVHLRNRALRDRRRRRAEARYAAWIASRQAGVRREQARRAAARRELQRQMVERDEVRTLSLRAHPHPPRAVGE